MTKPTFTLPAHMKPHATRHKKSILLFVALVLAMCVIMPSCQKKDASTSTTSHTADATKSDNATVNTPADKADDPKSDNTAPATKATVAALAPKAVGDIITFGHYEQDNDTTNGKEPITWRILDKNDKGQYLVVSEKILDAKPYAPLEFYSWGKFEKIPYAWEKSIIRSWLNGYDFSYNAVGNNYTSDNFIDAAFTDEEKAKIVISNVPAHSSNPEVSPGNPTTDKIFLLSTVEVDKYLTHDYFKTHNVEVTKHVIEKCRRENCHGENAEWFRDPDFFFRAKYDEVGLGSPFGIRPALWIQY